MIAETAVSMLPWPEIMTTGRSGLLDLDLVEQRQPVEPAALQPDVEEDQRRPAVRDFGERRIGVARRARPVALVGQDAGDEVADVGFVVNDQNVRRHV